MAAQPATATRQAGTRKLSEVARHLVQPSGIVSTGWPRVAEVCRTKLGVPFDRWQDGAGRLILAERKDGLLAATVGGVGMSLPRQVGKTYLLAGLIFGLCIDRPGLLVIWSAHHAKTHNETFLAMQAFAQRAKVAPFIGQVFTGSGDEEVRFVNGSRILFGARERGFGRGVPGVDVLVMDEAQILSDRALENMLATLNTSSLGLHLYIGTPPKPGDTSESFVRMRTEALTGESDDTVWIECGADPGCDPNDREQWAKANPSYPHRTPVQAFLRLKKKLKPDGFMREGLGVWDDGNGDAIFGEGNWTTCAATEPTVPLAGLAVACSYDMQTSTIVGAAPEDDLRHVKPLQHGPGTRWVAARVKELQDRHDVDVAIDGHGPGAVLIPDLEAAGVRLRILKTAEVLDACAGIDQLVRAHLLRHANYPELDGAVKAAVKRTVGDRWAWGRRQSASDISALEGATFAAWLVDAPASEKPPPPPDIF